ncbi:MAG: translocation/assembly module TamB domain-containing protein [Terracidiphilus sp.]|jgi:translocation and assembly module TamB
MRFHELLAALGESYHPHWHKARHPFFKVVAWISLGMTAFTLMVAVGVAILLNNVEFHSYLIRKAEAQAGGSLGVRVQLQNFVLHFSDLSVDLYGVTIDGASPFPNPPLLQVDHVQTGVRVVSILSGRWYLSSVQLDHPVVHIFVSASGVSNIPSIKGGGQRSNASVFDLGIRHAVLERGEIYYNDKSAEVAADLHDLEVKASFNSLLNRYSGRMAYSNGQLVCGALRPAAHNLEVQFYVSPTTLQVTQAKLIVGNSVVAAEGVLNDYRNPDVRGHYDIVLDGKQMGAILNEPTLPSGTVHTAGTIAYKQVPGRAALDALTVDGSLDSRWLEIHTQAIRAQINDVAAHYDLANGDATLRDLRFKVLGGAVSARGTVTNLSRSPHSEMTAQARGISLAGVVRALGPTAQSSKVTVAGALNAEVKATWGRTFDDLVASTDATVSGQVQSGRSAAVQATVATLGRPVNAIAAPPSFSLAGAIHATYNGSNRQLALEQSYLKTPQTNLTMNGVVSKHSSVSLHLQANDLREVDALAEMFRTAAPGQAFEPLGLAGIATFQGNVKGSTTEPHLTGQLSATDLQYKGTGWKVFRAAVDASPSQLSVEHAELDPVSHGHITFSGGAGLTKWSFTGNSPLRVQLNASQVEIANIARLVGQQIPVTGTMSAAITMHGTELNPVGNGSITVVNLTAYDQPVQLAKLTFEGREGEVHGELAVELLSGRWRGNATVRPREKTYQGELDAIGVDLSKLQVVSARNLKIAGVANLHAKGQGSFDDPQMNATLAIPMLTVQGQNASGIKLQANVANHIVNAILQSSAVNTSIQARAKIEMTGDYLADATLDTQGIPLGPLIAVYAPQAEGLTGETEIHATLHGPLRNQTQLEAHATLPMLRVAYGSTTELAAAAPIHIDYQGGVIKVQRSTVRGSDADLQFEGSVPVSGNGPMAVMLVGTVNTELAERFDPDIKSSGQLKFNIDFHGPASGAGLAGQINIVDVNFASSDLPVGLQHCNGVLTMTRDRLKISSFKGNIGGGTLTAQGGVAYRPAIQFDLGLNAQGMRVLYPQGMRENVDANLRLFGTTDTAVLGGEVHLSDLSFTPAFDLSSFVGEFGGGVAAPPSRGLAQNVQLNVAVDSTSSVNLASRTLSLGGTANLRLRGTAADPVVLGRVNLNSGDIVLNGNRFVLNGGTIQFVNPTETEPVMNVSLSTSIQQYKIDLRFQGPVDKMRTQYSSDPALPTADIINMLAFGKTTEASNASATPANQVAESLIASQVSSQLTSRVSKIAGISQLSINPVLAGNSSAGPPGANITIQQRVTGNLFVTFSTNVASTQSQTIQGQYQVSPRLAFSATRDPNGGFGFDTLIKKSW